MCLDYREGGPSGEPPITYVGLESEYEERIAQSFDDFLSQLVDEEADAAIRDYRAKTQEQFAYMLGERRGVLVR